MTSKNKKGMPLSLPTPTVNKAPASVTHDMAKLSGEAGVREMERAERAYKGLPPKEMSQKEIDEMIAKNCPPWCYMGDEETSH